MDSQSRALQAERPPEQAAGARLEAFIRLRWTRRDGGIKALAAGIGSSTETVYSWFRGDVEPNMGHLRELARMLNVSRSQIVAALDGEAEPLEVETRLAAVEETLADLLRSSRTSPAGAASPERSARERRAG